MKRWIFVALLAVVVSILMGSSTAYAGGAVTVTSSVPLLINGEEVQSFPATVSLGSSVCVKEPIRYSTESERVVFQGWSHGPEDECVTLDQPGEYSPFMVTEVLLRVKSQAKDYRLSQWVTKGTPTPLVVPAVVEEGPDVRYIFEEWDGGENPYSPENTIAPVHPMVLNVYWTKEVYIELRGPEGVNLRGTGWHPEGETVVLQATSEVYTPDGLERLRFVQWQGVNHRGIVIPSPGSPATRIIADSPHTIEAIYRTEYLVIVQNPSGTIKKEWVPEGEEVGIETPAIIEIVPDQERYSFVGWEGADLESQKGFLVVNRPIQLQAVYEKQYMVKVSSPYGASGEGWYTEGETTDIMVPEQPDGVIFLKRHFDRFPGYEADGSTLHAPVDGPLTVTADYRTQVDIFILTVIVASITGILLIYLITQWRLKRRNILDTHL